MADLETVLGTRVSAALVDAFGDAVRDADPVIRPADPRFGDFQSNAAMGLARQLGRPPREIAQAVVDRLDVGEVIASAEVAGPGFVNLRLADELLAGQVAAMSDDERLGVEPDEPTERVVIDYSSPNLAKEMHVGHLRSTVIGDALARVLELLGHRVVRQNHFGEWGTQFGMLIEHFAEIGADPESSSLADLDAFYRAANERFTGDAGFAERARTRVVRLQSGEPETVELWRRFVGLSREHADDVYRRLGVTLSRDDDRPESSFNDELSDVVAELDAKGLTTVDQGAVCVFLPGFEGKDGQPVPMIVRKSDGGFLYHTTDLAALRHRVRDLKADRLVYVVDARQRRHFEMLFAAATAAGWLEGVRAEHVAFGSVLGPDGRPFKTRDGELVPLQHLLDQAVARARAVVADKNPELEDEVADRVAEMVGIGAVKYADLSSDRVKDYVFDLDRMLSFDGNTAPYLQYAHTRIRSIFRNAGADEPPPGPGSEVRVELGHPAERALALRLAGFSSAVRAVGEHLEPHRLCTYLFDLATTFTAFYENCPVLRAGTPETRHSRLVLCDVTARALATGLGLLGIEAPERM